MKKILIGMSLLLVLLPVFVNATTYYVDSAGGNDANPGTSTSQAWKTLPKVASFTFKTGDDILFKRGGTFTGTDWYLRHGGTKSDPVIIGAYGTGEKPVFNSGVRIICVAQNLGYITIQDIRLTNTGTGSAIFFAICHPHTFRPFRISLAIILLCSSMASSIALVASASRHSLSMGSPVI